MQKQFSIKVPDELYVEKYTSNSYVTFNYDGPEKLYTEVQIDGFVYGLVSEGTTFPDGDLRKVVEVDADAYPSVAYYLNTFSNKHIFQYEDVPNPDGSIYKKPTNPRLQDYFKLQYNEGAFNSRADRLVVGPWSFEVITKSTEFVEEQELKKTYEKVKTTLGSIELDSTAQTAYNKYIQDCETYLTAIEQLYPWKYVKITDPVPPKLPLLLVKAISDVKAVLGD